MKTTQRKVWWDPTSWYIVKTHDSERVIENIVEIFRQAGVNICDLAKATFEVHEEELPFFLAKLDRLGIAHSVQKQHVGGERL